MQLERAFLNLQRRLNWADNEFRNQHKLANKSLTTHEVFLLNGLVDYAWQAWNRFSREYFVYCSLGCTSKNGVPIPAAANVHPLTEDRVSYLSTRFTRPHTIVPHGSNTVLRYEITWGDIDKILGLSAHCGLSNHATVTASFGGGLLGPKHLQTLRNAVAHLNKETHQNLTSLATNYKSFKARHPVNALYWRTVNDDMYAMSAWIEDMILIADIATEA